MQTESTNDREISISRLLDAPVELVWEVWTNPEHIVQWWGPNGFTNTIHKMDMVENGDWLLTMYGPDGKHYPNKAVFKEIIPYKKIVFHHFNPDFITTVTFEKRGKKTFLHWHMLFETAELFETVVKTFKADEGLKQNVEKLENYLFTVNEENNTINVKRELNAGLELVWEAWTNPGIIDQWSAPKPWRSETKSMDFQEGGFRLYAMVSPQGEKSWGREDFLKINAKKNFTAFKTFCDENGNVSPGMPRSFWNNVFSENAGITTVNVFIQYENAAHLEKMTKEDLFKKGITASLENLDEVLAAIRRTGETKNI